MAAIAPDEEVSLCLRTLLETGDCRVGGGDLDALQALAKLDGNLALDCYPPERLGEQAAPEQGRRLRQSAESPAPVVVEDDAGRRGDAPEHRFLNTQSVEHSHPVWSKVEEGTDLVVRLLLSLVDDRGDTCPSQEHGED
jgi:hypothetical protein